MAEIIQKVARTVKKTAGKVSKKATELASVTKYSVKIKAKEADLNEKFEELGKLFYAFQKNGKDETEKLLNDCLSEIDAIGAEIATMKQKIAKAKGEISCPSCGEYASPSKEACPKCKAPLEHIEVVTAETTESEEK